MQPRIVFERRATPRVAARAAALHVEGGAAPLPVRDVSLEGVGFEAPRALAVGERLAARLLHPRLPELRLEVEVAWCRMPPGGARPLAGCAFATVSVAQRAALRLLLAAEAGACLLAGEGPPRGFLVPSGPDAWLVLDERAARLAYVAREEQRWRLCQRGARFGDPPINRLCADLGDALGAALGLPAPPRLEPAPGATPPSRSTGAPPASGRHAAPPPPPPPAPAPAAAPRAPAPPSAPPPRPQTPAPAARSAAPAPKPAAPPGPAPIAGHAVRDDGRIAGYAARTGDDVWSLYDPGMEQIGVLSRTGASFTVFWLGEGPESSVAFVEATTFPEALAIAFDLENLPGLTHATITPTSRSEAAPKDRVREGPGNRVVFGKRIVGYACASAIDRSCMLVDKDQQQVALLSRDGDLYRIVTLGSSVDSSMEFFASPVLEEAVAHAFGLPGSPRIDPPLEL